jgi:predicted nucleotidyltransferase
VTPPPLEPSELTLLLSVLRRHPDISAVRIFGSRAKGTHTPRSDVDLAVWGEVDALGAEALAAELDELPLPYRFDVRAFDSIRFQPLREHIERVGAVVYEK